MKLTLFADNSELPEAWHQEFAGELDVQVLQVDYDDLAPHDGLVGPGNSYAIMNGGLDWPIREEFGVDVQDALQWAIQKDFHGQLPVGQGIVVPVAEWVKCRFRFLVYCPTMVYPRDVRGTLNALTSFYAALRLAEQTPGLETLACSGMAAGVGKLPAKEVASQMFDAWQRFKQATPAAPGVFDNSVKRPNDS